MPKRDRPEPEDDADRSFMALIDEHGWAVQSVFDEVDEEPNFQYSAGIYERTGNAELLVIGLNREVGHAIINAYGNRVVAGQSIVAGVRYPEYIDGFDVVFLETDSNIASVEFTCWAYWYYSRKRFPLLQLIWPDKSGLFPWESGFNDKLRRLQPILGDVPTRN